MLMITSPEQPASFARPSIFLGGGITDAPDWQPLAANLLGKTFATCFNPRRQAGFAPPDHPDYLQLYREQVSWEHKYLMAADVVLFWLPKEALCITTRFEIGWWYGLNSNPASGQALRPFAVGIEPGVKGDTYYRVVLPDIGVPVHSTLEATCQHACQLVSG
jgi:hypothetical protein